MVSACFIWKKKLFGNFAPMPSPRHHPGPPQTPSCNRYGFVKNRCAHIFSVLSPDYSQVEKEGLAIIFGVKKFHQYVYGCPFQIITDHKPLLGLLQEHKSIPSMAASRIPRWTIILSA